MFQIIDSYRYFSFLLLAAACLSAMGYQLIRGPALLDEFLCLVVQQDRVETQEGGTSSRNSDSKISVRNLGVSMLLISDGET